MALDKLVIGARIRKIREDIFGESRAVFGKRCNLNERHMGQIERGEYLVSLTILNDISEVTGFSLDYLVYGKVENEKLKVKQALTEILNKSDKEELQMYYKCITTIKNYVSKK